MRNSRNVVLLQIFLKRDAEYCIKELADIRRNVRRPLDPAMHDKRHLALVIQTQETPAELMQRLRNVLDVDAINNYWALIPNRNVVSKYGGLDSLATRVKMAYQVILNTTQTQDVREGHLGVGKNFRRNASIEVSIKRSRSRKLAKKPDRPNRG